MVAVCPVRRTVRRTKIGTHTANLIVKRAPVEKIGTQEWTMIGVVIVTEKRKKKRKTGVCC